jgi:hypothetical protein
MCFPQSGKLSIQSWGVKEKTPAEQGFDVVTAEIFGREKARSNDRAGIALQALDCCQLMVTF